MPRLSFIPLFCLFLSIFPIMAEELNHSNASEAMPPAGRPLIENTTTPHPPTRGYLSAVIRSFQDTIAEPAFKRSTFLAMIATWDGHMLEVKRLMDEADQIRTKRMALLKRLKQSPSNEDQDAVKVLFKKEGALLFGAEPKGAVPLLLESGLIGEIKGDFHRAVSRAISAHSKTNGRASVAAMLLGQETGLEGGYFREVLASQLSPSEKGETSPLGQLIKATGEQDTKRIEQVLASIKRNGETTEPQNR